MRIVTISCALAGVIAAFAVLAPGAARAQGKGEDRLVDAYKREFAFLEAEKRTLEERLDKHRESAKRRLAEAKKEVSELQAEIVGTSSEAQRIQDMLRTAERELESMDRSEDVVSDILLRAESAYSKVGVKMPEVDAEDREALLGQVAFSFDKAPEVLERLGTVRVEDGAYFDDSGERIDGEILHVGDIAAYGLAEGARGVLAPAGQNRLKLWDEKGGAEAAGALAAGDAPETLPVFLFESLDEGIEKKDGESPIEVVQKGGMVAWVIVSLGALALIMVLIRAVLLARASLGTRRLVRPVLDYLQRDKRDQAIGMARRAKNPTGRVLTATLTNLDKERDRLEDLVAEAVLDEQPQLSRFGSAILVLAAVSPLMGLLGTVTGMISTFDVITEFGTGNPKLLSGGISEALITTELGLMVAIPSLLFGHLLTGWSEKIRDNLDAAALSVVNRAHGMSPPADDASLPGQNEGEGAAAAA